MKYYSDNYAIGIDTGFTGGISVWNYRTKQLTTIAMPITKADKIKKTKVEIDVPRLIDIFKSLPVINCDPITIESVHSMPKQGVTSTFRFGHGVGLIHGITQSLGYQIELVTPQKWKKHFGLIRKDKNASRAKATELYPNHAHNWKLVKQDGIAEATLIMRYGIDTRMTSEQF